MGDEGSCKMLQTLSVIAKEITLVGTRKVKPKTYHQTRPTYDLGGDRHLVCTRPTEIL